jgi:hypothetical protein
VQNPIREQIRLDGHWQTRRIDGRSVSVFVPGSWADKQVVLRAGEEQNWRAEPTLQPGQWNKVELPADTSDGARLVASDDLRITRLQAGVTGSRSLGIRIALAGTAPEPCLLTLDFTLTAADGRRTGAMDVVVSSKNRDLSLEMDLPAPLRGPHRLKATLSCGERVVDNARIDINP